MATDASIRTLINLIGISEEGAESWRTAADGIAQAQFKTLFDMYAQQRTGFVQVLKQHVRRLGGNPEGETARSLANRARSLAHQGWINLKAAATGGDRYAILAECERGEDFAVAAYEDALIGDQLPQETQAVVRSQYKQIRDAHRRIRDMRDAARPTR